MRYSHLIVEHIRKMLGRPKVGAEVGAWIGGTTNIILKGFPKLHMYIVDPWDKGEPRNTTARRLPKDKLVQGRELFRANTAWAANRLVIFHMMSLEGCKKVKDGKLDFIFIDGDHRYQPVKDDLNAWWPKVRPGGLLFGHDYRVDPSKRFGVIRATDEFLAERKLTKKMLDRTMYVICKP